MAMKRCVRPPHKVAYSSYRLAEKVAIRLYGDAWIYWCPGCGWWHVTQQSPADHSRRQQAAITQ